jgi:hypothetical protein
MLLSGVDSATQSLVCCSRLGQHRLPLFLLVLIVATPLLRTLAVPVWPLTPAQERRGEEKAAEYMQREDWNPA